VHFFGTSILLEASLLNTVLFASCYLIYVAFLSFISFGGLIEFSVDIGVSRLTVMTLVQMHVTIIILCSVQ